MSASPSLRERQAPLKARYEADPTSAKLTITVRSVSDSDDPTRCRIATVPFAEGEPTIYEVAAHPMAGGSGEPACSGDVLLASLAACQEITLRMVAAAMRIRLDSVAVTVEGDMDFRGTMGLDAETPVGFERIRTKIEIEANAPLDRLERLVQRAEQFCVVAATLSHSPELTTTFRIATADEVGGRQKEDGR